MAVSSTVVLDRHRMPDERKNRGRTVREGEVWFNVRISDEQKARLDAWARRNGASASLVMRLLLQEALDAGRDADGLP